MSKKDAPGLRSPRFAAHATSSSNSNNGRVPVPPLQLLQRYTDADGFSPRDTEDHSIFQRYVADNLSPTHHSIQATGILSPRPAGIHSPRLSTSQQQNDRTSYSSSSSAATTLNLLSSLNSPHSTASGQGRGPFARTFPQRDADQHASQSPAKLRHVHLIRPHSPVGEIPPESVMSMHSSGPSSSPRTPRTTRRTILAASDVDKITRWLQSLEKETQSFASYQLYCEMLFRESRVLTQGKPVPNRLQTAVAFHCLCKATIVFARHEHILVRICRDLGAAIFVNSDELPIGSGEIEALECFSRLLTYYDNQNQLQQQRDHMSQDMLKQRAHYESRLREEQLQLGKMKDLEHRYQIKGLDKIAYHTTAEDELADKLHVVLHNFQYMDDPNKQRVVLSVIESLHAHVTADTLFAITEQMTTYEKDKLLRQLFQDGINQITEKIHSEVLLSSSVQQNVILERSVTRITRFQSLITETLRTMTAEELTTAASGQPQQQPHAQDTGSPQRMLIDDDDLSDQDRKVLEAVSDMVDELQLEKKKNAELTKKFEEAEQLITSLRWKHNALTAETQEYALKHAAEVEAMRQELLVFKVESAEKEVQTYRRGGGAMYNDDEYDEYDGEDGEYSSSGSVSNGKGGRTSRRRLVGTGGPNDEEDLLIKNRRTNKFGVGIASIIEQAKIPSSKIRKILSKRKPLTLNELHAIIIGYYQAKMFQDVQDDNVGKLHSNLAQFIMEMYVLHYGLKDLAISQLVFLDASIRKHARESARVRTFGLLTGSLDPESHACSVQGIDFFLFVVVVIFNAGVYKKGRKQAVTIAQNLKGVFGDGIFMSSKATTVKSDLVCQTLDLVFSFTRNDPGGPLDHLKDEIRRSGGGALGGAGNGGLDVDLVLEKLMNYWFTIYEQQIQDIHAMFTLVDANGDGMLDFREFCEIVVVLEPEIDRRDALALYNRAAGEDHVIDKDEFVQVMLAHQRGIILKEFYGGDSSKKIIMGIQQRKNTFASPATNTSNASADLYPGRSAVSLEYQSLAGAMTELDREESYASLAAAMSSVAANAASMDEDEDDGPMNDEDSEQQMDDHMKESVSFMTLSRLSLWAAEAKGKLQGGDGGIGASKTLSSSMFGGHRGQKILSSLKPVVEQQESNNSGGSGSGDGFEQDVDELLRQALSKVNIQVDNLFTS